MRKDGWSNVGIVYGRHEVIETEIRSVIDDVEDVVWWRWYIRWLDDAERMMMKMYWWWCMWLSVVHVVVCPTKLVAVTLGTTIVIGWNQIMQTVQVGHIEFWFAFASLLKMKYLKTIWKYLLDPRHIYRTFWRERQKGFLQKKKKISEGRLFYRTSKLFDYFERDF